MIVPVEQKSGRGVVVWILTGALLHSELMMMLLQMDVTVKIEKHLQNNTNFIG